MSTTIRRGLFAARNQQDYGVDTAAQVVEEYKLGGVLYFAWVGNTSRSRRRSPRSPTRS